MKAFSVDPVAGNKFRELGFAIKPGTNTSEFNGEDTNYERIYSYLAGKNEVTVWIATSGKTGKSTVNIERFDEEGKLVKSSYKKFGTPKQFQTVVETVKKFVAEASA